MGAFILFCGCSQNVTRGNVRPGWTEILPQRSIHLLA